MPRMLEEVRVCGWKANRVTAYFPRNIEVRGLVERGPVGNEGVRRHELVPLGREARFQVKENFSAGLRGVGKEAPIIALFNLVFK